MEHTKNEGVIIKEFTHRSLAIQNDIEHFLIRLASICKFTWKEPIHDIARRVMNEISEFQPLNKDGP